MDLRAEIDEQGLERVASDRRNRGLGLGQAGLLTLTIPTNSTSNAHGTTEPSDRGVGGRGEYCSTFVFCSFLSSARFRGFDGSRGLDGGVGRSSFRVPQGVHRFGLPSRLSNRKTGVQAPSEEKRGGEEKVGRDLFMNVC